MKHENEPEENFSLLPICNFCDKTYDPFDVHTCPGNQIIPRKVRTVVEDEGAPSVTVHHPRCRVLQYGASDCDCGAKHKAEWDRTMQDLATVCEEIKARSALSTQPGGDHYRKHAIQPVEYIVANGISFLAGNIVKYATRYKDKGGAEDIRKIKHYCDLILEFEYKEKT